MTETKERAGRRRTRRGEETRRQLIEACIDCLTERGYAGTSIEAVMSKSGISRGSVLNQFPTRLDLMTATIETAMRAINEGHVYHFFTKPCNHLELAMTIRRALQQKAVLSESKRLNDVVKHQTTVLKKLEKAYPGITNVYMDEEGAVILDDSDTKLEPSGE